MSLTVALPDTTSKLDAELANCRAEKRRLSRQLAALRAREKRQRNALLRVAAIVFAHDGDSMGLQFNTYDGQPHTFFL